MTTISKDAQLITLINVFTVDPSNQSQLVELLTQVVKTTPLRIRRLFSGVDLGFFSGVPAPISPPRP